MVSGRPGPRDRRSRPVAFPVLVLTLALLAALAANACAAPAASVVPSPAGPTASPAASGPTATAEAPPVTGTVRLYTTVQQPAVDAVASALALAHPGITLDVFRAPTGEVAARIAAEEREGGIKADVLWLSDPLSIDAYARRGLVRSWQPAAAARLDPAWTADSYWGTRILNVVMVARPGLQPAATDWDDLADPAHRGAVGLPDPAFAGSAFGALGAFSLSPDFRLDWYRRLAANQAVVVNAPDEVTTGVAEGRFDLGMTLDFSVRQAIAKGSPVQLVWPASGSIAIYSPIGVVASSTAPDAAEALVELVLSEDGQRAIAGTGWEPVLPDAGGPKPGGRQLRPDWPALFGRQQELLDQFASIFGR